MAEQTWIDGIVTHIYTENGDHITECDEEPFYAEQGDSEEPRPRLSERSRKLHLRLARRFNL